MNDGRFRDEECRSVPRLASQRSTPELNPPAIAQATLLIELGGIDLVRPEMFWCHQ